MGSPSGVSAKAAVKRAAETTGWTDSTIGTVRNQIPLLSEGVTYEPIYDVQGAVMGSAAEQQADVVGWKLQGPISTELWYESLEPLFLAALGYENPSVYTGNYGAGSGGSPAPDSGTPNAYVHVFECDDVLNNTAWSASERTASSGASGDPTYWLATDAKIRNVELFIYKEVPAAKTHWHQHCYVRRATWRMKPGECVAEWDLVGRTTDRSAANGYATTWALPTTQKRCLFPELHVYVSTIGAALSTEYGVREVEITLENNLQDAEFATAASGAQFILEPIRDGDRKITGKLKIPRYTTEQWESWRDAKTALQMRVSLTSTAVITGSSLYYAMDFLLPLVYITKVGAPASGPGVITVDVEFMAVRPTAYQTWLSTLLGGIVPMKANEFLVRLVNQDPACYSRDRQAAGVTLP